MTSMHILYSQYSAHGLMLSLVSPHLCAFVGRLGLCLPDQATLFTFIIGSDSFTCQLLQKDEQFGAHKHKLSQRG